MVQRSPNIQIYSLAFSVQQSAIRRAKKRELIFQQAAPELAANCLQCFQRMKAVLCEQYGGREVLEIVDDLPVPRVGPNGVLVQVHATSVNPVDWKFRKGLMEAIRPVRFPAIWGCDLSGVVAEVGPA